MSRFLDPTGRSNFGIALCARCSKKFFIGELSPDPNSPGLMVCANDRDVYDPYRLPQRMTEDISLPFVRPDESIAIVYGSSVVDDTEYLVTEDGSFLVTGDGDRLTV